MITNRQAKSQSNISNDFHQVYIDSKYTKAQLTHLLNTWSAMFWKDVLHCGRLTDLHKEVIEGIPDTPHDEVEDALWSMIANHTHASTPKPTT